MSWQEVKPEHLVWTIRPLKKHPLILFHFISHSRLWFQPPAPRLYLSHFYIQALAHDMPHSWYPFPTSSLLLFKSWPVFKAKVIFISYITPPPLPLWPTEICPSLEILRLYYQAFIMQPYNSSALFMIEQCGLNLLPKQCKGWTVSDVVVAFVIAPWVVPEVTFSLMLSSHIGWWFLICLSPTGLSAQAQDRSEIPMS